MFKIIYLLSHSKGYMRLLKATCFLLFFCLVYSCGDNKGGGTSGKLAKGNVYYGGVFRMNENADFRSLFPLDVTEVTGQRITDQIYEGLVKLSQSDLSIIPSLAEKWEKNEDATVWTFYIRKGVKFHDDACFPDGKGREVTANDFKYCFDKLCESFGQNQAFAVTFKDKVVGASEYYQSTIDKKPLAEGVKGVKVMNDYKLQVILLFPSPNFLNILTDPGCRLYPKEAFDKYGIDIRTKCVGTGPFRVKNIKEGDNVILERNPNYWRVDEYGNELPYLDIVKFTFVKEKKSEFLEFKKGNLDMIFRLPTEMIPEILDKGDATKDKKSSFEIQIAPAMSVFYYGFLHQSDIFSKKEVRQAFNYAIDRNKIVNYMLQGEGIPANYGIVPPVFKKDYDYSSIKGYVYDPDQARKLLAEAGYKNGKGFPKMTLQTNSDGGERNIQVAEVTQRMLKENLNINIDINVMPRPEHYANLETGNALFWRATWQANYPDPESFLNLLYGKNVPANLHDRAYMNSMRYKSPKFDSLFAAAVKEVDSKKRFDLYVKADQVAVDDAAVMPIFYDEHYRLLKLYVKNFPINAMEYRDLTKVYIEPSGNPKAEKTE